MHKSVRPSALRVLVEGIPAELMARPQLVNWRYELSHDRWTKVLKNPHSGRNASSTAPTTWGTFKEAFTGCYTCHMDGIGFVFTAIDPYCGVDLDKCRDPINGLLDPWAAEIIMAMQTYTEVSPSRTGVKLIARATLPPGGRRKGLIEMYDSGRFFTITGHSLPGQPDTLESRQAEIEALHTRIFANANLSSLPSIQQVHITTGMIHAPDDDLIALALQARHGQRFARLWAGDTAGYPSHSEADAALCGILAFWCGPDPERIDRLFRRSKLYREKWDHCHYAGSTVEYIRVDAPVLWESPPLRMINLANGLLDLDARKLVDHSPKNLSPVQLPVTYDQRATCPAWEKFVGEVFPADAQQLDWEIIAWLMRADTSIQRAILKARAATGNRLISAASLRSWGAPTLPV